MMPALQMCLERFLGLFARRSHFRRRKLDSWSLFLKGRALDRSHGNRQEAFRCYLGAARNGHPAASTLTGMSYRSGSGVHADPVAAEAWWRQAAALGEPGAEILLEPVHDNDERGHSLTPRHPESDI
jgi:TPR repeat protein